MRRRITRFGHGLIALVIAIAAAAAWVPVVRAGGPPSGGDLIWEDRQDPAGGFDSVAHVAARGPRLFAAGLMSIDPQRGGAFVVRAYDLRNGQLLWQHQDDRSDQNDIASRVAATEGALFAVGGIYDPSDADWLVRSFDPVTGAVLWEDQFDHSGGNDYAFDVVATGKHIYVSGIVLDPRADPRFPNNFSWLLRAYDAATGGLLWQSHTDLADGNDQSLDLAFGEGHLVQVGFAQTEEEDLDYLVRAWDAATGVLLWSDQVDGDGGNDVAHSVAIANGRVLVAGTVGGDFCMRAYELAGGALLWEDRINLGGGEARALAVELAGKWAYGLGYGTNATGNLDLLVRAYEVRTGELAWADRVDEGGGDDVGFELAVGAGEVFAVGQTSVDPTCNHFFSGNCAMAVRAYQSSTGKLAWAKNESAAGANDYAFTVTEHGGRVVVGGRVFDPAGDADWALRVYAAHRRAAVED